MKLPFLFFLLALIFSNSWLSAQKVLKSKSYYYLNDTTRIPDSMFTTTKFYGSNGKLYREEESHYKNSKLVRQYVGIFKDEFIITEMYENDKLIMKLTYDSFGTVIKHWALTNNEKDSDVIAYIPYYESGKLIKRDNIFRGDTSSEYYEYFDFQDSSVIVIKERNDNYSSIERTSYTKSGKVIYKDLYTNLSGRIQERTVTKNEYDDLENILSITETTNGREIMKEVYYYKFGKKSYSIKKKSGEKFFIKTFYE